MACSKCGEVVHKCNCDKRKVVSDCNCPTKVNAGCVFYDDKMLTPLGVVRGNNLEEIIIAINDLFSGIDLKIEESTNGVNLGNGSRVFKGKNSDNVAEFRTLREGVGILLSQTAGEIKISTDLNWLQNYLKEYVNEDWFEDKIRELLLQPWFVDLLQNIFLQDWFGDVVRYWVKKDWFKTYLEGMFRESWFQNVLEHNLSQAWFEALIKNMLYRPWFSKFIQDMINQEWFINFITDLVNRYKVDVNILNSNSGVQLFVKEGDSYVFRGLVSTDGSVIIRETGDGNIDLTVNPLIIPDQVVPPAQKAVENNSGIGTGIVISDSDDKAVLAKIKSDTLRIVKDSDGNININTGDLNYLKRFYVNSYYTPTADSPSDGSIIRPFRTFDEAFIAAVGNGTIYKPQHMGSEIVIQTDQTTAKNPTINRVSIVLEGTSLTYTGEDPYMFDTDILKRGLYNSVEGLTDRINIILKGRGKFARTKGTGVVRSVERRSNGSPSSPIGNELDKFIAVDIKAEDAGIELIPKYSMEGLIDGEHMEDDNVRKIGNRYTPALKFYYTTRAVKTTPIVYIENIGHGSWQYPMYTTGKVIIVGNGIDEVVFAKNTLVTVEHFDIFPHVVGNNVVNAIGANTWVSGRSVYTPVSDSTIIHLENGVLYGADVTVTQPGSFDHLGYENFFKLIGSNINVPAFKLESNYYFENLINAERYESNVINLNAFANSGYKKGTPVKNLLKVSKNTTLIAVNYHIENLENISNAHEISVRTDGAMTSIKGVPYMTGLVTADDANDAKSKGLVNGAFYLDGNSGNVKIVS